MERWRAAVKHLQQEAGVMVLAFRDSRTPWYAKAWLALVLAHTFSPIDLIPDFIPVLGQLDDLIIAPLGFMLALRMIPAEIIADARRQTAQEPPRYLGLAGTLAIVVLWLLLVVLLLRGRLWFE